jgi:serine/threonine-protein kinase HipA
MFSILISNTDDHLRNHGFLHEHDDVWRMAPAFDLNPDPAPGPKRLSQAIDASDRTADCRLALAAADSYRLTRDTAGRILTEVATAVSGWQQVAASYGLTPSEVSSMAPAFAALGDLPA